MCHFILKMEDIFTFTYTATCTLIQNSLVQIEKWLPFWSEEILPETWYIKMMFNSKHILILKVFKSCINLSAVTNQIKNEIEMFNLTPALPYKKWNRYTVLFIELMIVTLAMMTCFFKILMAYRWLVVFSLHRITLPKVPFPRTFRNSKSSKDCNNQ